MIETLGQFLIWQVGVISYLEIGIRFIEQVRKDSSEIVNKGERIAFDIALSGAMIVWPIIVVWAMLRSFKK